MKKFKKDLKQDKVDSDSFHVGIELELIAPCGGNGSHDDDACYQSHKENMEGQSSIDILMDYEGFSKDQAKSIERYFNKDLWVEDYMQGWECHDESSCPYSHPDGDSVRGKLEKELTNLIGNTSIKVEEDGSLDYDEETEADAEVCWNYFASRETLKDNEKILKYLEGKDLTFNETCGLHINLNNYLKIPRDISVPTSELSFLFNFVADSRETSTYCNEIGLHGTNKYGMIFNQEDRLEFRFFSPTLNPEELHHYVVLANTIYKRLAGKDSKLPKKTAQFLAKKMTKTKDLTPKAIITTIKQVNELAPAWKLAEKEVA